MIQDALKTTRTAHRLILAISLWTILFSLTLTSPSTRVAARDALSRFFRADFVSYDAFVRERQDFYAEDKRLSLARWRGDILAVTQAPITGLDEIVAQVEAALEFSEFRVEGSALEEPQLTTFAMLRSAEMLEDIHRDIVAVEIATPPALDSFTAVWNCVRSGRTIGAMWLEDLGGRNWKELDSLRLWIGPGSTPTSAQTACRDSIEVPVTQKTLTGTSFNSWIESVPRMDGITSLVVTRAQRARPLQEAYEELAAEVGAVGRRSLQVTFWDVQIPLLAIAVASPLVLVVLSYVLAMHTLHLRREAAEHVDDVSRFAWLPLALRSNGSWFLATAASVAIVPGCAPRYLWGRLDALDLIDRPAGSVAMVVVPLTIVVFGLASLYNIDRIRATLGKRSVVEALTEDPIEEVLSRHSNGGKSEGR